jgi:hypothetical protein
MRDTHCYVFTLHSAKRGSWNGPIGGVCSFTGAADIVTAISLQALLREKFFIMKH